MFQLGHHEPLRLWLALLLAVAAAIAVRGQQPELGTWEVAPDGQAAAWRGTLLPGNNTPLLDIPSALAAAGGEAAFNVSLVATNASGADLALYCSSAAAAQPPSVGTAEYASDRVAGSEEVVFVSPRHYTARGQPAPSGLVCSAFYKGPAGGPAAECELRIALVPNVTQDPAEAEAAAALHSACCQESGSCAGWEAAAGEAGQADWDLCFLPGSFCNAEGRLLQLNLTGAGLRCDFPADPLSRFAALQALYLGQNQLRGDMEEVAAGLAPLADLRELVLSGNPGVGGWLSRAQGGGICALAGRLRLLHVAGAALVGSVPGCLFEATAPLLALNASANGLNGTLPGLVAGRLQTLRLAGNNISGPLPEALAGSGTLRLLDLSGNALAGSLPQQWGGSLELLSLAGNQLTGAVPPTLTEHSALEELNLAGNRLAAWLGGGADKAAAAPLTHLSLAGNNFSSSLPMALFYYPALAYLNASAARLDGTLPPLPAGAWQQLFFLDLSRNGLGGAVPDSWSGIGMFSKRPMREEKIGVFDLSSNALTGALPSWLGIEARGKAPAPVDLLLFGNAFTNGCYPDFGNIQGVCTANGTVPASPPAPAPVPSTSPAPSPPPQSSGGSSGLSGGAVAAIVICCLLAAALVAGMVVYTRRRRQAERQAAGFWGGGARFEKFEEEDYTRPPRDLELAGPGGSGRQQQEQQWGANSGYPQY